MKKPVNALQRPYDQAQAENAQAPLVNQFAGSAAWANKPHYGLTPHRRDPAANEGELHVTKVKQGLPGKKTDKDGIPVMLDFRSWEFVEIGEAA